MLSAIIVAAGSSTRAGFDKVFAAIAGRPVIEYSLDAFARAGCVDEIIVVSREETMQRMREIAAQFKKVRVIIPGGQRRQDSVAAGINAASGDFLAVHDAARPLITSAEIERVFEAAEQEGAAVLAAPVTDTLKLVDPDGVICGAIDRENVFAMQTPQIFARELLVRAYEKVRMEGRRITDEVSAVQAIGGKVAIALPRDENMKITFAHDLALAELILKRRHPEPRELARSGDSAA